MLIHLVNFLKYHHRMVSKCNRLKIFLRAKTLTDCDNRFVKLINSMQGR